VKVTLAAAAAAELQVDALAVAVAASEAIGEPAREVDRALGGVVREVLEAGEHRGRVNEVMTLPTGARIGARRLLLYGVGATRDLDGQRLRSAHHEMVRAARTYGYRRLAVLGTSPLKPGDLAGVVEGCVMGTFEPRSRQTAPKPDRGSLDEIVLAGFGLGREHEVVAAMELGEATNRAREWQNMPPNELTPEAMAQEARQIAQRHGLEIEVLGGQELRAGGYNLMLGVAAGSSQPPRLVRLVHRGARRPAEGEAEPPMLALVGKGITFDTGGISLKDPKDMHLMKGDMAGAAAVLAAIEVIGARKPAFNAMAVIACTENMPGGSAQRPGDVVVSADGKTVEITNTDAEGRLVLADAITHALRNGATHIIDLATLTGAARVAVGHAATAAISNDDGFWQLVEKAADGAGERVWRLPIYSDYRVLLRSQIADLRNADYGEAGTITGGMFIGEFTKGKPWAHLDIAASSWNSNSQLTTIPRGPSGAGTRLCVHLAELLGADHR
jgi:leucyl aminopeptidase